MQTHREPGDMVFGVTSGLLHANVKIIQLGISVILCSHASPAIKSRVMTRCPMLNLPPRLVQTEKRGAEDLMGTEVTAGTLRHAETSGSGWSEKCLMTTV